MSKIQDLIKTAKNVPSLQSLQTNSRYVAKLNEQLTKIFEKTEGAVRQANQIGKIGPNTAKINALHSLAKLNSPLQKLKTIIESSKLSEEELRQPLVQINNTLTKISVDLVTNWERELNALETKYRPLVAMAQAASLDKDGELARSLANISEAKSCSPLPDEKLKKLINTLTKIVSQFDSLNLSEEINAFLRDIQNEGALISSLANDEVRAFLNQHKDLADSLRINQLNG